MINTLGDNINEGIFMSEKYGFVYLWYDRKHKRFYIGCRWGREDDGYICSSVWMKQAYGSRPFDFKRRILKTKIPTRQQTYEEEQRWLSMIKSSEIKPTNPNPKYYNLNIINNEIWHKYEENIKTIGAKISAAKKGKPIGPCSPEKAASISAAKKAQQRRHSTETKAKISAAKKGIAIHDDQWKQQTSERLKQQWSDGTRNRAEPKIKLTKEQRVAIVRQKIQQRWGDPVWAANQKAKLQQSAKSRPPRSEQSKIKASLTQKGKSKPRLNNINNNKPTNNL